ncbi:MAG: thioredoxin domain-containing protein [Candidatus Abyssobacteria bacterium SURF_17]|uniref:Thioredoxin domain-containing protein n=1 Tax=Candidatus Abyssobacteria bacterium SURF_17 TaxID=2093361 RepID=A0A419EYQ0_9BACT|nr:MAG: thioredoxin domain-containing protein [Candidatus Abyssubacteria bacterium SURF_17]
MADKKTMQTGIPSPEKRAKLPPDGGSEFNRLIHEKSPYLLQHAHNPVDWYPWGKEAFVRAERENKPIFLSVGYSTCHWCHVMERESFESEEIADVLNKHYVSVKVDREERPDIDEIYMNATQLIAGRGGWPNSVWLLPDGRPWYAGTYFPPDDMHGRPGFRTVLLRLAEFWHMKRPDVEAQANQLADVMKRISSGQHVEATGEPKRTLVEQAFRELRNSFDERLGGFGDAPKFPPHGSLGLIFHHYQKSRDEDLLNMATRTLDAMALGGIRDHVGGGFHRYSTDAQWLLPHFEKMLYDNAQLSRAYTNGYLATKNEHYREIAEEIFDWMLREMLDKDGGFHSALDADSEGEEGKFYVWRRDEVVAILGPEDAELFCRAYNIEEEGNFHDESTGARTGANIPHLRKALAEIAQDESLSPEDLRTHLDRDRRKLLEHRSRRIWPHLDDKVLASWNGLMIASLAYAGRNLKEARYTSAAEKAATFILTKMRKDGRLLRSYREGTAKLAAYLDDYAFLADGLLELYETTQNKRWLDEAEALVGVLLKHYYDKSDGGFFFTADDHESLLTRSKDPYDKAIPSGNGTAARVLVRLACHTGNRDYLKFAESIFRAFLGLMQRGPRAVESMILALDMYLDELPSLTSAEARRVKTSEAAEDKPDTFARKKPVSAEAFVSRLFVAPGGTVNLGIKLAIDGGWHINSNAPPQNHLAPTSLELKECPSVRLDKVVYPPGKNLTIASNAEPLSVYDGETWLFASLKVKKNASEGKPRLDFEIHFQACDDRSCLSPETVKLSLFVEIRKGAIAGEGRHRRIFEPFKHKKPRA